MNDCIFCKMIKGDIPYHKIWEDDKYLAILSIFPNTEGFSVVLPKEHHTSYVFEQSDKVMHELMSATKKVANILDNYFKDVGRCGMFFEGFGVDHLHSKLFPMHGTACMQQWAPIERKENKYFSQYPGYLSSHDSARADDIELATLAQAIQKSYL